MLKISLIVSVLGIILLFFIAKEIEISSTTIEKINREKITGEVVVIGSIKEIQASDKFTRIIIAEESELLAVAFSRINLSVGDTVEIRGRYEENSLIIDEIKTKYI